MKQPKRSIRFAGTRDAWCGDVVYKTDSDLACAARTVPLVAPADVLAEATITVRTEEDEGKALSEWLIGRGGGVRI
ncbi:hypothetical protein [Gordonibacter sp.]|uniref:hypothetical protein n=1 Tax=Gordonibacter sp. TaxID=1968902 RepID=UPI002FC8E6A9